MKEDLIVVNPQTGEVITEICEGDKIVREKQDEFSKTHELNFNNEMGYIKLFNGVISELCLELAPREFKFVMLLTDYIGYSDCVLRHDRNVLTLKDISKELNFSYDVVRKIMPSLIQKGILSEYKTTDAHDKKKLHKGYAVNPYIFFRGRHLDKPVYEMFKDSGWKQRLEQIDAKYKNN